jgi:hypothetical protein
MIGIKLKSMISATKTDVRWLNLICIERGEPQRSIYSMKKSFTLQPRDLCCLKKFGWGAKFALYENFSSFIAQKLYCFHKNRLTCNGYRKVWWISTEHFWVKSFWFFVGPQKMVQFVYLWPTAEVHEKKVGAESVNTFVCCDIIIKIVKGTKV